MFEFGAHDKAYGIYIPSITDSVHGLVHVKENILGINNVILSNIHLTNNKQDLLSTNLVGVGYLPFTRLFQDSDRLMAQ